MKAVFAVLVDWLFSKLLRQINDRDSAIRAPSRANPAASAYLLVYNRLPLLSLNNALLSRFIYRAHPNTKIIAAAFGVAFFLFDNCYSCHLTTPIKSELLIYSPFPL